MNVSQPTSAMAQAAVALPPRSALPTQLGVDAGSRLYEFWNAIFARAGASMSEQPTDVTPRPHSDSRLPDEEQDSNRAQTSGQGWLAGGESVLRAVSPSLTPHGGADPLPAQFQALVGNADTSSIGDQPTSFARSPATRASTVLNGPDAREPVPPVTTTPLPAEKSAPPQRSNMSDSVSVFLQGGTVSIVVRDATLSAHDAVYCGFETARQLTGHRSALSRLTLNGQTLYQRQAAGAQVAPALLFAC